MPNESGRLETGVVQVEGDWPGVFIRGDNAAVYAWHLNYVLGAAENNKPMPTNSATVVSGLLKLLNNCRADTDAEIQLIKNMKVLDDA